MTVYLLYGLILLQAYCMKLHYTSGLRLITLLLQCPHWCRATLASRVWLASGTIVAVNGMLVYAACRGTLTVRDIKLHYTSGLRFITLLLQCPHRCWITLASRVLMASGTIVAANGMPVYTACLERNNDYGVIL